MLHDSLTFLLAMALFPVRFIQGSRPGGMFSTPSVSVGIVGDAYVADDGVTIYVADDGVTIYAPE